MKLYAIKRKGYDIPYNPSYHRDIALYETYDGVEKALAYEVRVLKKLHNRDYSKEYEILEYDFDYNNYKVIK